MSLHLITPPERCRHYHHTEAVFPQKKEKETLDAAPSVIANHDSVFLPHSGVTSGRVKKLIHRGRWLEETGGPACQAYHSRQWTHYYDIYKAS